MSARVLCHMDASDTIKYVSQKAQTVPGHGKATPVGIPCVRPQCDMRCYRLDRCDLELGSLQTSYLRPVHLVILGHWMQLPSPAEGEVKTTGGAEPILRQPGC